MDFMDYPEPTQLEQFARKPMLFHSLADADLEEQADMTLEYTVEYDAPDTARYPGVASVTYRFTPAYICIEVERDEYERVADTEYEVSHEVVWENAGHINAEEDFLTAHTLVDRDGQARGVDATWLLDDITFKTPAIDRAG